MEGKLEGLCNPEFPEVRCIFVPPSPCGTRHRPDAQRCCRSPGPLLLVPTEPFLTQGPPPPLQEPGD